MGETENKVRWTITIDPELARRYDLVAEAREENRSEMIERILKQEIEDEEAFLNAMEHPLKRAIIQAMANTPGLMVALATLAAEEVDIEKIRANLPDHVRRGKQRAAAKRTRGKEATA